MNKISLTILPKILIGILIVALSLIAIIVWGCLAFIMACLADVYVSHSWIIVYGTFILSFIGLGYLGGAIIKINIFKRLIKIWERLVDCIGKDWKEDLNLK